MDRGGMPKGKRMRVGLGMVVVVVVVVIIVLVRSISFLWGCRYDVSSSII
jgi:hypothetical protein